MRECNTPKKTHFFLFLPAPESTYSHQSLYTVHTMSAVRVFFQSLSIVDICMLVVSICVFLGVSYILVSHSCWFCHGGGEHERILQLLTTRQQQYDAAAAAAAAAADNNNTTTASFLHDNATLDQQNDSTTTKHSRFPWGGGSGGKLFYSIFDKKKQTSSLAIINHLDSTTSKVTMKDEEATTTDEEEPVVVVVIEETNGNSNSSSSFSSAVVLESCQELLKTATTAASSSVSVAKSGDSRSSSSIGSSEELRSECLVISTTPSLSLLQDDSKDYEELLSVQSFSSSHDSSSASSSNDNSSGRTDISSSNGYSSGYSSGISSAHFSSSRWFQPNGVDMMATPSEDTFDVFSVDVDKTSSLVAALDDTTTSKASVSFLQDWVNSIQVVSKEKVVATSISDDKPVTTPEECDAPAAAPAVAVVSVDNSGSSQDETITGATSDCPSMTRDPMALDNDDKDKTKATNVSSPLGV